MTNKQIATQLANTAIQLIEQYKNDKNRSTLQEQLVRKFLAILNHADTGSETDSESKATQVRTIKAWGPYG